MKIVSRKDQSGSVAIEFSIVFALLFAVFWAIISYALPFFLYQVMNHAVAEAARDAVRYEDVVNEDSRVKNVLNERLEVLPQKFRDTLVSTVSYVQSQDLSGVNYSAMTITLEYPGCRLGVTAGCITPVLNLLGASIPNLGPYTAKTTVRLSRSI